MVLMGYLGFIVLVLILSCFNALNWRYPIHLVYAAYVVTFGLAQLSLTGLTGKYARPDNPSRNDSAAVAVPMFSSAWAALLVQRLLDDIARRPPKALRFLRHRTTSPSLSGGADLAV